MRRLKEEDDGAEVDLTSVRETRASEGQSLEIAVGVGISKKKEKSFSLAEDADGKVVHGSMTSTRLRRIRHSMGSRDGGRDAGPVVLDVEGGVVAELAHRVACCLLMMESITEDGLRL